MMQAHRLRRGRWLAALFAALLCCSLPAHAADAADTATATAADERLQVTDPFIELHTGPGRGYPVFHVAARHEWIRVELRHTDWYRVRTDDGKVGWVQRTQLESTLTAGGQRKSFRDIVLDDYLHRKVDFGLSYGRFQSEPLLKLWTSWRYAQGLGVEAAVGQVQGVFSGTDFWHVNLVAEPWQGRRFSPFFNVGLGNFKNIPNASLVDATPVDARLGNAGLGLRWYISERFVARADWNLYTAFVSDAQSIEYRAVSFGLAFFF